MTRIDTTARIGPDRQLVIQLPQDVPPGEHRVTVLIDRADEREGVPAEQPELRPEQRPGEPPLRWEGTVLVFDGEIIGPHENLIQEIREERIRSFFPEGDE